MDPKLSGLDPKLKEAYDRVMAGPSSAPAANPSNPATATPASSTPQTLPVTNTPLQQAFTQTPPIEQPPFPTSTQPATPQAAPQMSPQAPALNFGGQQPQSAPAPTPTPVSGFNSTVSFNAAADIAKSEKGVAVKKGGSKLTSIVIILGLSILLVAYTFVWIFVFKLKIPGLPF